MNFKEFCKNATGMAGFAVGGWVGSIAGAVGAGATAIGLTKETDPGKTFEKVFDACVRPCVEVGEDIGENYVPGLVVGIGARVAAHQINNLLDGNNNDPNSGNL